MYKYVTLSKNGRVTTVTNIHTDGAIAVRQIRCDKQRYLRSFSGQEPTLYRFNNQLYVHGSTPMKFFAECKPITDPRIWTKNDDFNRELLQAMGDFRAADYYTSVRTGIVKSKNPEATNLFQAQLNNFLAFRLQEGI